MDLNPIITLAQAATESAPKAASAAAPASGPLNIVFQVVLFLSILLALVLVVVIYITGKGDAMSGGGGGVRTNFKGKASFDDKISQYVLYMGVGFMGMMVLCDWLLHQIS
jgi:preprotein translocase subunit SecG